MPSRHERLKVRVGSISFLIFRSASSTIGPQALMSTEYSWSFGFTVGFSGSFNEQAGREGEQVEGRGAA